MGLVFIFFCSLIYPIHKTEYISGEIREKTEFKPSIGGVPNILLENNGSPICSEKHTQINLDVSGDDDEGALLVWEDQRNGVKEDLYAQRMDGNGKILWEVNGTPVCLEDHEQKYPQICSDGAGGAFITWMDYRPGVPYYDIYAQRVNSTGDIQWGNNGTAVCTEVSYQWMPKICSDGSGGAIIVWRDHRNGVDFDIYAQWLDSDGNIQWGNNGTVICNASGSQAELSVCGDGTGGIIVVWEDYRSGSTPDLYIQHISSSGITDWGNNGTAVCTEVSYQYRPKICGDGSGGAIVVWEDTRYPTYYDIFTQRINSSGNILWTANGTAICTEVHYQREPRICGDGKGGAFIIWEDERKDKGDIYAQYINSIGETQWDNNGTAICTEIDEQDFAEVCFDGKEGIVIAWDDYRSNPYTHIYAQYVNLDGVILWETNGSAIFNVNEGDAVIPRLVNNKQGSIIIAWEDYRSGYSSGNEGDIYGQIIRTPYDPVSNHPIDIISSIGFSKTIDWILQDDSGGGDYRVWATDIHGNEYLWIDWTPWSNNSPLSVPINYISIGEYDYTIEYYDEDAQFGINDTVKVTILEGFPSPLWDINGIVICNSSNTQESVQMCSDGNGGVIIVWVDLRNESISQEDIYAQRVNSIGEIQWTANGIPICIQANTQQAPKICSDGMGGAFIVWADRRTTSEWDIYGQRINSTGAIQWDINGVLLCTAIHDQSNPSICYDGQGGIIVSWRDTRNGGTYSDVYAQRFNSSGHAQWGLNDIPICLALYTQNGVQICSDGNNGAIIIWNDHRSGNGWRIYSQRVNSSGDIQWFVDGNRICAGSNSHRQHHMSSDGLGGIVVTWQDMDTGDIYAQRVNSTGDLQWNLNGLPICVEINLQQRPRITSDGNGGAFITWEDHRNDGGDIYIQCINRTGSIQWELNGMAICIQPNAQTNPQICYDNNTGTYLTWEDYRNSTTDIYAQWLNLDGLLLMGNNGTVVCSETNEQILPQIFSNEYGGAFVAWEDYRNDNWDIYGQYINFDLPPISNHPEDIMTDKFSLETIDWTLDDSIAGGQYRVIVNDIEDYSYVWVNWTPWDGYTILNIPINRTRPGTYNYIINYYDSKEQYGITDEVEVIILDLIPFSNHPEDIQIDELDITATIDWILIDDYGTGQYRIIKDGIPGTWLDWVNNTVINYIIDTSTQGTFNYTISYYDSEAQFGIQDTVRVDITVNEGGDGGDGDDETPPATSAINGYYIFTLCFGVCLMMTFLIYKLRRKGII